MIVTACFDGFEVQIYKKGKEFFGTCPFWGHFLKKMSLSPSSFPVRNPNPNPNSN